MLPLVDRQITDEQPAAGPVAANRQRHGIYAHGGPLPVRIILATWDRSHSHTYAQIHRYAHIHKNVHLKMRRYIRTHAQLRTHIHACKHSQYTYTHVALHTHTCTYTCTHARARATHTKTHIYNSYCMQNAVKETDICGGKGKEKRNLKLGVKGSEVKEKHYSDGKVK